MWIPDEHVALFLLRVIRRYSILVAVGYRGFAIVHLVSDGAILEMLGV